MSIGNKDDGIERKPMPRRTSGKRHAACGRRHVASSEQQTPSTVLATHAGAPFKLRFIAGSTCPRCCCSRCRCRCCCCDCCCRRCTCSKRTVKATKRQNCKTLPTPSPSLFFDLKKMRTGSEQRVMFACLLAAAAASGMWQAACATCYIYITVNKSPAPRPIQS